MSNPYNIQNPYSVGPVATPATPFDATPLGIAKNTITGLPSAALDVGKDIFQGIARSFGSAFVGLGELVGGAPTLTSKDVPSPFQPVFTSLFGDQPLKDVPLRITDLENSIKNSPLAQNIGLDKFAFPLAIGGIAGDEILNFTGLGGSEKAAISTLAKESDAAKVLEHLLTAKVEPNIAEKLAPMIAKTSDPTEIKSLLSVAKGSTGLQKLSGKTIGDTISPELQSLADEARKYGSAEEFVQAQNLKRKEIAQENVDPMIQNGYDHVINKNGTFTLYHKTTLKGANGIERTGFKENSFFADSAESADALASTNKGGNSKILEIKVDPADISYNSGTNEFEASSPLIKGKDGVYRAKETQTQSQLTDFYNQATKKVANRGTKDLNQLYRMLDREEQSLAAAKANPEGHAKAYGGDMVPTYEAKIKELKGRIAEVQGIADEHTLNQIDASNLRAAGRKSGYLSDGPTASPRIPESQKMTRIGEYLQDKKPQLLTPATSLHSLGESELRSLQPILKEHIQTVKQKVRFTDYLATPEFVLEKLGLKRGAELLHEAQDGYRQELPKNINKITDWYNRVKQNPDAPKVIFQWLDGQEKEVTSSMTQEEIAVAREMRAWLRDWAERLGLPKDNRIAKYITHIFEKDFIQKEFDPELAKIIDEKVPGSVYDPFLQARLGKKGYIEDAFLAMDAYVKRATRKVHMDPALEILEHQASDLDIESYKYVQRLASRVNMRPTELDNLIDNNIKDALGYKFGVRPVAQISRTIRQIFYRGTLGLNFGSALRNLTQGANTYAKLGEKYTVIGYTKALSRLATNNLKELYDVGVLNDNLIEDRNIGVYKSILQKIDPILFGVFDLAEKINRGSAYWGAKARAINNGATEAEAVKMAKRLVRETQFNFGAVDSPVVLSGDLAKTLLQLQSYNVKQGEFLARMIKNKEFGGLIRYTAASIGMLYTIGKLFGMKPTDLIPSVGIGGSPIGNIFNSAIGMLSPSQKTRDETKASLDRNLAPLIPAGVQARKSYQGYKAYKAGKSTSASGKTTQYKIPHNTETFLRAIIFGKSALPQAQAYYKKLNNPAKKSGNPYNL